MNYKGHFGLSLFIISILSLILKLKPTFFMLFIIFLTTAISTLPDIDLKLGIPHRTITHTMLFALIISGILAGIFYYYSNIRNAIVIFIFVLIGITSHILGDLMNYQKMAPFWPFSSKKISFRMFQGSNIYANNFFFLLGILAFFLYLLYSNDLLKNFGL